MLNKCQSENDLASFVSIRNRGIYHVGDLSVIVDRTLCTSLIMNAIAVWNTKTFEKAVTALGREGRSIPDHVLGAFSPITRKHINLYGSYGYETFAEGE